MPYAISANKIVITINGSPYSFWKTSDEKIIVPDETQEKIPELEHQIDSLDDLFWTLNYYEYVCNKEVFKTGQTEVCFVNDY